MRFFKRVNGTLVLTSRITLVPGQDDQLIALIEAAPDGQAATLLRELMRCGLQAARTADGGASIEAIIRALLDSAQRSTEDYSAIFAGALEYQHVS